MSDNIATVAGLSNGSNMDGPITSGSTSYVVKSGTDIGNADKSPETSITNEANKSADNKTDNPKLSQTDSIVASKETTTIEQIDKKDDPIEQVDKWSSQFEKLSKKDAEIRSREKAIQEKEADLARLHELQKIAKEKGELAAIQALGWSPDRIIQQIANNGKLDPSEEIKELRSEIKSLKEESNKQIKEVEQARLAELWNRDLNNIIGNDEYKIVREWDGALQQVIANTSEHYEKTGELLHPKVELDKIKEWLQSRIKKLGYQLGDVNTPQPDPVKASKPVESKKPTQELKTMNPKLGAVAPTVRQFIEDEEAAMAHISARYT